MSNLVVVFYENVEYATWIPLYLIVTKTEELSLRISAEIEKSDKITEMDHYIALDLPLCIKRSVCV